MGWDQKFWTSPIQGKHASFEVDLIKVILLALVLAMCWLVLSVNQLFDPKTSTTSYIDNLMNFSPCPCILPREGTFFIDKTLFIWNELYSYRLLCKVTLTNGTSSIFQLNYSKFKYFRRKFRPTTFFKFIHLSYSNLKFLCQTFFIKFTHQVSTWDPFPLLPIITLLNFFF